MIVTDSSYFIAAFNPRDAHHFRARTVTLELASGRLGNVALLEYVFLETVTVLITRLGAESAISAGRSLLETRDFQFVPCSELFASTFETFATQTTTRLSLTDIAIARYAHEFADGKIVSFDEELRRLPGLQAFP